MLLMSLFFGTAHAGGLLTNTNQSIAFCRNFAREGAIAIDGVYSNPAGVAFMPKGFHLSVNVQNVYQTRDITSSITVPSLEGTSYYQPFRLNGGNEQGIICEARKKLRTEYGRETMHHKTSNQKHSECSIRAYLSD